jgi:hypothetical protein
MPRFTCCIERTACRETARRTIQFSAATGLAAAKVFVGFTFPPVKFFFGDEFENAAFGLGEIVEAGPVRGNGFGAAAATHQKSRNRAKEICQRKNAARCHREKQPARGSDWLRMEAQRIYTATLETRGNPRIKKTLENSRACAPANFRETFRR